MVLWKSRGRPHDAVAPRGGDEPTRERVARSILEHGPSTAAALAERLDLTPAAVRRHLDHLLAEGALEAREPRVTAPAAAAGPAKVFALTEAGRDALRPAVRRPGRRRRCASSPRPAATRPSLEFARRRVAEHRGALRRRRRAAEPELTPAEALAEAFTARATPPRSAQRPGAASSCASSTARSPTSPHEFPQLCEAETEAIGRVLGRHVQRLATIAHGDGVCTTCIPHATGSQRRPAHRSDQREDHSMTSIEELNPELEGHRPLRVRLVRPRRRRRHGQARPQRGRRPRHLRARRASRSGCSTCA